MRLRRSWSVLLLATLGGCSKAPTPQPAEAATPTAQASAPAASTPEPAPLSAEDIRLIEADPATLSPEERRKRAYALRRKIMQNPDSPAARTLEDLAKAAREGTIDPHGNRGGITLHQAGSKPTGGAPPAGYRPPPEGEAKAP